MRLCFYVSGHGLGHAARQLEVMKALLARAPATQIHVRTSAPRWLFDRNAPPGIHLHAIEVDPGVVQPDSLTIDEAQTIRRARAFYADFDDRVEVEATFLREAEVDLVVSDIPPLACAAAARAALPSVAVGNFTWDWIYGGYEGFDHDAPEVLPTIRRAYATANLALRLPLHGGFDAMRRATVDVPLIARRSTRDRAATRRALQIPDGRPAVVASFGGHGVQLPLEALARSNDFTFVDADARTLDALGLAYQDVIAAVDVVVSKPGYGIVSECVANGAALVYTSRGRFREYDVFVAEMPRVLRCRFLSQPDVLAGRWSQAVEAVLAQPMPPERLPLDGADATATAILEFRPTARRL